MCECNKGHWVKHEKLVKKWGDYTPDIYWTCSVCGYQPYEGADYVKAVDKKMGVMLEKIVNT